MARQSRSGSRFGLILATVIIVLGVTALGAEMLLRFIPNEYLDRYRLYRQHGTTNPTLLIRHVDRDKVGYVYQPDSRGIGKVSGCYANSDITTNSQGYNDGEWTETFDSQPFRMAVLGDSFAAAMEVPSSENSVALMRELSGLPIMNAGINGYQPPQELDTFRATVLPHRPSVVLWYVFTGNDIGSTHCRIQGKPSCYEAGPDGTYAMRYAPFSVAEHASKPQPGLVFAVGRFLGRHLVLAHAIRQLRQRSIDQADPALSPLNLYTANPAPLWSQAWGAFEQVARDLRDEVAASGARLVMVVVPTHAEISPTWKRELSMQFLADATTLDNDRPSAGLSAIAGKLGVPVINPVPFMRSYIDRHNLPYPYFAMRCDGHWNPLGHYLMANFILAEAMAKGVLPDGASLSRLRANLERAPTDIMEPSLYGQIFGRGGFYDASLKIRR